MRTIKCQICGKEVEAKSSRQKYCPECAKEVRREKKREQERERRKDPEYREKRNAREREYKREWRKDPEFREREREYKRERRKDPEYREKEREYNKTWRENNKEYFKEYNKNYRENNKEYFKEWHKNNYILADREGNNFCVYIHTDPVGKVYIGRAVGNDVKTVNRQRWGGGTHYRGQKFHDECIAVYGWDNIQHELLEWGLTYEEVLEREQYWIERYNSRNPEYGYNIA